MRIGLPRMVTYTARSKITLQLLEVRAFTSDRLHRLCSRLHKGVATSIKPNRHRR